LIPERVPTFLLVKHPVWGVYNAGGHCTHILHLRRMKMKKKIVIISMVLATLLIAGCSSAPKVYDKSVPLEQSSTLVLYNTTVMNFDDKFVGITPSWMAHNGGTKEIIIPAGTHTLSIYAEYPGSVGRLQQVQYKPISYEFLPGRTYVILKNSLTSDEGVRITDLTEELPELVPDPTRTDASPFEGVWVNIKNAEDRLIFSGNEFMMIANTKTQPSWRGTFSYNNSNTVSLKGTAVIAYIAKRKAWMTVSLDPRPFTYNGETLKGGGPSQYNKEIEFRRAK